MYKVYCDDILIHSQVSPDPDIHLINPTLKLEQNAAGSFEFTIASGHAGYNDIERISSTIAIEKEVLATNGTKTSRIIWTGRVIQQKEDFWKRRTYVCEGALAFLNDTLQPNVTYTNTNNQLLFRKILEVHNNKKTQEANELDRSFEIGSINVVDSEESYEYQTNYEKTWDVFKAIFLDRLEGIIYLEYNYPLDHQKRYVPTISYLSDYKNTASQMINFGDNLLDFTKNWDMSNVATVIVPKGQKTVKVKS